MSIAINCSEAEQVHFFELFLSMWRTPIQKFQINSDNNELNMKIIQAQSFFPKRTTGETSQNRNKIQISLRQCIIYQDETKPTYWHKFLHMIFI